MTGYALRAANITIERDLDPALPAILVDPDQVTQVFTNLIVNAEQALRRREGGRRLRIVSAREGRNGDVVITIEDNGPGVPEEIRRRVFEPFFTTKAAGEGTGIGLALCHRVLEAHGGEIELADGAEGGARFTVRLPADAGGAAEAAAVDTPAEGEAAARSLSILVVDDQPEVIEVLREILAADGHRVATARDGHEALTRIRAGRFDLILSDVRMPDMDGPALRRALAEEFPEIERRLAFLTGDTLSVEIRAFLAEVGRPHVEKPFLPEDVRGLVRDMIAKFENEAER